MQLKYTAPRASRRVDPEYRDRVREMSSGRWFTILQTLGVSAQILTGEVATCPECGGSFKFLNTRDRGEFICREPRSSDIYGDGFALVRHLGGDLGFDDAVRAVGEALGQRELSDRAPEKRAHRAWRGTIDRWAL